MSGAREEYLAAVCAALAAYREAGYPLHINSVQPGEDDPLTIAFTLDEAQKYHSILDRLLVQAGVEQSEAASG